MESDNFPFFLSTNISPNGWEKIEEKLEKDGITDFVTFYIALDVSKEDTMSQLFKEYFSELTHLDRARLWLNSGTAKEKLPKKKRRKRKVDELEGVVQRLENEVHHITNNISTLENDLQELRSAKRVKFEPTAMINPATRLDEEEAKWLGLEGDDGELEGNVHIMSKVTVILIAVAVLVLRC
eukprot:TRINITY_DN10334_c0_g1_i2.p1 TRINITY_DN10334_c0_g1~~TRINITY_DN10334_c0_g1_i2.p1  ORF type:complete len:210 (-),score=41.26 TRINITY_DN10334_c0_g1_i2:149-694(-)